MKARQYQPQIIDSGRVEYCAKMIKGKTAEQIAEMMKNPVFRMVARKYEKDRQKRQQWQREHGINRGILC
ncbi:hypothetical protein [Lonepinella sp. BR2357]|uniref:hypothetical protein n=1 Tax=Lonepinella sp. BR2357 TaxID=3434549 RepID=UPI003F6DAF13